MTTALESVVGSGSCPGRS